MVHRRRFQIRDPVMFKGEASFMWWIFLSPFVLGLLVTIFAPGIIRRTEQARALATASAVVERFTPTPTPTPTPAISS